MQDNNNFTKEITLSFGVDDESYKTINTYLESLKADVIDEETMKNLTDLLKQSKSAKPLKFEESKDEKEVEKTENMLKSFVKNQLTGFGEAFTSNFTSKLNSIGTKFASELISIFKDAWSQLDEILSYSRLTNQSVREQAFTYGFNPSQNYAYSRAMSLMGMSNIEDLAYMNSQQRSKFVEKFNEYADRYSSLYDSGFFDSLEEFNWEWEEFQEDLRYTVMQFFVDNKDVITGVMDFLMSILSVISNIASFLFKKPAAIQSSEQRLANAERISSSYSKTTNITIDNTFNNVKQSDRAWLANAGAMTYEQFLRANGGR